MDLTPNYNLGKPFSTEMYNVGVQNTNMDTIDTELKAVADQIIAAVATLNQPHLCTVVASAPQSIPDAAGTKISFPAAPTIIRGCTYSDVNDEITIVKAGIYLITGAVGYNGNATGARYATIQVDGAAVFVGSTGGSAGAFNTASASILYSLTVGKKVSLATTQFSGGALSTTDSGNRTQLSVLWVSDAP